MAEEKRRYVKRDPGSPSPIPGRVSGADYGPYYVGIRRISDGAAKTPVRRSEADDARRSDVIDRALRSLWRGARGRR